MQHIAIIVLINVLPKNGGNIYGLCVIKQYIRFIINVITGIIVKMDAIAK